MSLSFSTGRTARGSGTKVRANLLAERGLYELHDRIRTQMWADASFPSRISGTSIGSYSARVLNATSRFEHVVASGTIIRRQIWNFEIEATGTTPNGIQSMMRGQFSATADSLDAGGRRRIDVMSNPTSRFTPSPISNWVQLK